MNLAQLGATQIVAQVMGGRNLNQALAEHLRRHAELTPQQRAIVQDLSYGTLRFYGQLAAMLAPLLHKPLKDERLRFLLLVALFQLQYSKSASHAVVDHAVRAARELSPAASGLVNAVLRNFLRQREMLLATAAKSESSRYSYPQWWIDQLRSQYGARADAVLLAGNQHPPMTLRVNQRRTTPADYLARLAHHGIEASLIEPDAILLARPVGVDKLPGFFDGEVSVQDAGAQYAAPLLDAHTGMRVLDACAAPGGKSAHLLELADIQLTALDLDAERLQRVDENLRRLQLSANLKVGDAAHPADWWDGVPFDRILADVPCSATGVVRRHPDIKWLRRPADIAGFARQQAQILEALWHLLASGGKLLYATCSVMGEENRQVVQDFLRQHVDAHELPLRPDLPESGQLLPGDRHDGFFYALLQKSV
ncbi:16S rRNA (cytosine(967)-C(5))-methyltransferase RsmB [Ferriphaselus sp. R-1]|uniref:16S rRNA (cytosine(967)-C(5))-methyltransferase RsmB n=1 Tax=Ferriphaselus sp. R-1 TaxID=1485544 RepID=UPI00055138C8|nr:16S rRNA (cytosine(967)-C(5))-methyltransferase RsmB [Ferriphaselus sp. R-1]